MDLNIEKAIKFQFEDKNWKSKSGGLMIMTGLIFVMVAIFYIGYYVWMIATLGTIDSSTATPDFGNAGMALGFFCVFGLFMLLLLFWGFFLSGYQIDLLEKVMKDQNTELPNLSPVGSKIARGFKMSLMHILPTFVIFLLYTLMVVVSMVMIGFGASGSTSSSTQGVLAISGLGIYLVGMLVFFILLMSYTYLFMPVANYLFIKRGLSAIFAYGEMFSIVKKQWLNLLIVGGLNFAIGSVMGVLVYIPCVGWILYPVALIICLNAVIHLHGQIFAEIEKDAKAK
jgi:hypothetical protein